MKRYLSETTSDEPTEAPPANILTERDILHPEISLENISIQPAALGAMDQIEIVKPSETSQTSDDSMSKTIDPVVMESFRSLSKRPPVLKDQPQLTESFKFVRRKAVTGNVTSSTAKYLDMTKRKTTKKTNRCRANKKRTLYSQDDDEPEEGSWSHQNLVVGNTSAPETIEYFRQVAQTDVKSNELSKNIPKPASPKDETSDTDAEKENERCDDVRYDPYERGCQRPGLRLRRYAKLYWINNGTAMLYRVTYSAMTKEQCKEEEKLVRHGRTADNKHNQTKAARCGSAMVVNSFASLATSLDF